MLRPGPLRPLGPTIVSVLAAALSLPAPAPATPAAATPASAAVASRGAAALQRTALADDGAFGLLAALTTEVGHRFAGSPRDAVAIAWLEAKARALGAPKVWTEPVTVPRWVRGDAHGEIVSPWPQPVAVLALGGSVGTTAGTAAGTTAGTGAGAPSEAIEAEVVRVESLEAIDQLADAEIRGKIVFIDRRMPRTADGSGYGDTVPIRGRGAPAAGKRGAVAVLIRSVATDSNRLPHTGSVRYEEGGVRIPAAALSVPDADLLARQLASGRPVRFRLHLGARYEGEAQSANVLAEIPGRERPDEIVLLVAHHDSWDVGTGAQDNGTGVALLLDTLRRLAANAAADPPRRTLRVLLTANEEFGLSGARAYASAHAAELDRHAFALEMDSGAGRALRVATRFAPAAAEPRTANAAQITARPPAPEPAAAATPADLALTDSERATAELADLLAPLGIERAAAPASGGADLSPLEPAGLPLVDLDQDRSFYFDIHHTENDTLDKVDPSALRQLQAALVTVAHWATHREQTLPHLPPPPKPSS